MMQKTIPQPQSDPPVNEEKSKREEEYLSRDHDFKLDFLKWNRDNKIIFGWCIRALIITLFIIVIAIILNLSWHLFIAPDESFWLESDKLEKAKDFIFSGSTMGMVIYFIIKNK